MSNEIENLPKDIQLAMMVNEKQDLIELIKWLASIMSKSDDCNKALARDLPLIQGRRMQQAIEKLGQEPVDQNALSRAMNVLIPSQNAEKELVSLPVEIKKLIILQSSMLSQVCEEMAVECCAEQWEVYDRLARENQDRIDSLSHEQLDESIRGFGGWV